MPNSQKNSRARSLALGCLLLTLSGLCSVPAASAAASGLALPLSHAGRWITDGRGRVVILHGVNQVFKTHRPTCRRPMGSATTTPRS